MFTFLRAKMLRERTYLLYIVSAVILLTLGACSSNNFFKQKAQPAALEYSYGYGVLPDLENIATDALCKRCEQQQSASALDVTLTLHCVRTLLGRDNATPSDRKFALIQYNSSMRTLFHQRTMQNNLVQVHYVGPDDIFLVDDIIPSEIRLTPTVFGEIGAAAVTIKTTKRSTTLTLTPIFR